VLRANGAALFYPVQYEGLEQSEHIVYLGLSANQQIAPALDYLIDKAKVRSAVLVGSDYVYPRAANRFIRDELEARTGDTMAVLAEQYRPLGNKDWAAVVDDLLAKKPGVVINTINGNGAMSFYETLREAELKRSLPRTPVLSLSLTANELRLLPPEYIVGDYLSGAYFDTLVTPEANAFSDKVARRSEGAVKATDMMSAMFSGVHLWAGAVERAKSSEPMVMLAAVRGAEYRSPVGLMRIDDTTLHARQPCRVARIRLVDGKPEFQIVSAINEGIAAVPFPVTRTRPQWEQYLGSLYREYDGAWAAPSVK